MNIAKIAKAANRQTGLVLAAIIVGLWVLVMLASPAHSVTQLTLYVSPTGSDSAAGTQAAPLRTLNGARIKVRTLNASMTGDIEVLFRGGTYRFTQRTIFSPADSGMNGHRVIYKAYPGETPIFDGGVPVTGWTQHSGDIWVANLSRTTKLRSLYVDGQRATLARSSGVQAGIGTTGTNTVTANSTWAMTSGSTPAAIVASASGLPSSFTNIADMEVVNQVGFSFHVVGLSQISVSGGNATLTPQAAMGAIAFSQPQLWGAPFFSDNLALNNLYIQNARELLDTPGEFYFDNTNNKLYYYKPTSVDLATTNVTAPIADRLIELIGTSTASRVSNITFSGITMLHTHWLMFNVAGSVGATTVQSTALYTKYLQSGNWHDAQSGGTSGYGNTQAMPAAVKATNASGIHFVGNVMEHLGSTAISFANDVTSSQIIGNVFNDISGSGIEIGDAKNTYINDGDMPSGVEGVPTSITVSNNVINRSGAEFLQTSAIAAYYANGLTISHNEISNVPYTGISMGWGFNAYYYDKGVSASNVAQNNIVEYNRISNTMTVMHDGGAIYTLGAQPASSVRYNIIEKTGGVSYGNPIYTDQSSSGFEIHHNIIDTFNGTWWFVWGEFARITGLNVHDNSVSNVAMNSATLLNAGTFATNYIALNNRVGATSQTFATTRRAGLTPEWRQLHRTDTGQLSRGTMEGEWGTPLGRAAVQPDNSASGKRVMAQLDLSGDGVSFSEVTAATGVTIRYASPNNGTVGLYVNGVRATSIPITSSGSWFGSYRDVAVNQVIPAGATVAIKNDAGDVGINLDQITFDVSSSTWEAERGAMAGRAVAGADPAAWGGSAVTQLDLPGDSVTFASTGAANRLLFTYASTQNGVIGLYVNGVRVGSVPVMSTGSWQGAYRTVSVDVFVPSGSTIMVKNDPGDVGINLDRLDLVKSVPLYVEAESGAMGGRATACFTGFASFNQTSVCQLDLVGDSVSYIVPRQATLVTVRMASALNGTLSVYINGVDTASFGFVGTGGWFNWSERSFAISVPAGGTLMFKNDPGDSGINIDSLQFD